MYDEIIKKKQKFL